MHPAQSFQGKKCIYILPVKYNPSIYFFMRKIMKHLILFPFLTPNIHPFPLWSLSWQYLFKTDFFKTVSTEGNLKKTSIVLEDEFSQLGWGYVNTIVSWEFTYAILPPWEVSKKRLASFINMTIQWVTFQTLSPPLKKLGIWSKGN